MIYKCLVKCNDENDVLVNINGVDLLCFSNVGIYADIGNEILLNIDVYDDFNIRKSNKTNKEIEYISGYEYKISGFLNIEKGGVESLIFFQLDDLYDYAFLDGTMVDLYILRLNVSNI